MADVDEQRRTAFGLALRIDPRIPIAGLGLGVGKAAVQPSARVRLDAAELDRRWRALESAPVRTREVSFGQTLLRTVDFDESAGHLLWVRGCGRVLISPDGSELLCAPERTDEDWASMLASQALPLAATIRGLEVLHASGVVLNGEAVLFVGPSGVGKTSLAAALLRSGAGLLSDDAVALSLSAGALIAHPGSATLHMRSAEEGRLAGEEISALGRPAGTVEGRRRYASAEVAEAAPLGYVFVLERSERDPLIEPLQPVDPFELIGATFNVSVRTAERLARQLDFVSAIASGGVTHRLRVRPGMNASFLAELVREHIGAEIARRARSGAGLTAGSLVEL